MCLYNSFDMITSNGNVILINAFLKNQKYGKEIVNGCDGTKQYIVEHFPDKHIKLEINNEKLISGDEYRYLGLLVIGKNL